MNFTFLSIVKITNINSKTYKFDNINIQYKNNVHNYFSPCAQTFDINNVYFEQKIDVSEYK